MKVIVAHFASEGRATDDAGASRPCWELLLEMMAEPRWEVKHPTGLLPLSPTGVKHPMPPPSVHQGLLFADVSALTIFKRLHVFKFVLEHPEVHHRLVFGSDYPVCALGGRIIGTRPQPLALLVDPRAAFAPQLVSLGLTTAAEARAIEEVFQYNPLLSDLVLKLTARHPSTGRQLPPGLFGLHPQLPVSGPSSEPARGAAAGERGAGEYW